MTLTDFLLARIADDYSHAVRLAKSSRIEEQIRSARELAECEAKRRIVGLHEPFEAFYADGSGGPGCYAEDHDRDYGFIPGGHCATLCALAAVYADHPDCDESWLP